MSFSMKRILISAVWIASSGAFAQGMNGGAAEAKGASGTSNPNGIYSANQASRPSGIGANRAAANRSSKQRPQNAGAPAQASKPGASGS